MMSEYKLNISEFDIIEIRDNQLSKLMPKTKLFYDNNPKTLLFSPLDKALIRTTDNNKNYDMYFHINGNFLTIGIINPDINIKNPFLIVATEFKNLADLIRNPNPVKISISKDKDLDNNDKFTEELERKTIASMFISILTTIDYLYRFKQEIIQADRPLKLSNKRKKSIEWHNRKNPNNVIRLTKAIYTFPQEFKPKETNKPFTRLTECWGVRGHWRIYKKSGKQVWIKEHKKGTGEKSKKIYKIQE